MENRELDNVKRNLKIKALHHMVRECFSSHQTSREYYSGAREDIHPTSTQGRILRVLIVNLPRINNLFSLDKWRETFYPSDYP